MQIINPAITSKIATTDKIGLLAGLLKQNKGGFVITHSFFEGRAGYRNSANDDFLKNSAMLLRLLPPENILFVHVGEKNKARADAIFRESHVDPSKFQYTYDMESFISRNGETTGKPLLLAGCQIALLGGFYSDEGACIDDTKQGLMAIARREGKRIEYVLNDMVSKSSADVTFSYSKLMGAR